MIRLSNGLEVDVEPVWGLDGVNGLTVLLSIDDFYPEVKQIWVSGKHKTKSGKDVSKTLHMRRLSLIDGRRDYYACTCTHDGHEVNFIAPEKGSRR